MRRAAVGRLALGVAAACGLTAFGCSSPPDFAGGQPADRLRAGLVEWAVTTSAAVLAPQVVITVRNAGTTTHDLRVQGRHVDARTPRLAPGESATLDLDLQGERSVRLICTVSGHAAQGMSRRLLVGTKG